jgi:hypothetical protein
METNNEKNNVQTIDATKQANDDAKFKQKLIDEQKTQFDKLQRKYVDNKKSTKKTIVATSSNNAKLTIDDINANDKLRIATIDALLIQLSNCDKTTSNDAKIIRRNLRSLNHTGGLRASKYSKTKSIYDFVDIEKIAKSIK